MLGTELSLEEVASIFIRLQFEYTLVEDEFIISVPLRRWDISIEADLLEEVARVYGYNKIPSTLPMMESTPGDSMDKQQLTPLFIILREVSSFQTISYALSKPKKQKDLVLKS